MKSEDLRKASAAVFIAMEEGPATDLSEKLEAAAQLIDDLTDFANWMVKRIYVNGYTPKQQKHFIKQRDKLLTLGNGGANNENKMA